MLVVRVVCVTDVEVRLLIVLVFVMVLTVVLVLELVDWFVIVWVKVPPERPGIEKPKFLKFTGLLLFTLKL